MLSSHMWSVAATLANTDIGHVHHCRKFCGTTLLQVIVTSKNQNKTPWTRKGFWFPETGPA